MKKFLKQSTIKFYNNRLFFISFRKVHNFFQTKYCGSDILIESKKNKALNNHIICDFTVFYYENCFDILKLMSENDIKYINIEDKNNLNNVVSYKNVLDVCLLNEWFIEEDVKIIKELMTEK